MAYKQADAEKMFFALDKDGSGYLTMNELQAGAKTLGVAEDKLEDFMRSADKSADGKIDIKGSCGGVLTAKPLQSSWLT
ncbi:uncharacterized protein LOC144719006 [Lampetra planeri]